MYIDCWLPVGEPNIKIWRYFSKNNNSLTNLILKKAQKSHYYFHFETIFLPLRKKPLILGFWRQFHLVSLVDVTKWAQDYWEIWLYSRPESISSLVPTQTHTLFFSFSSFHSVFIIYLFILYLALSAIIPNNWKKNLPKTFKIVETWWKMAPKCIEKVSSFFSLVSFEFLWFWKV